MKNSWLEGETNIVFTFVCFVNPTLLPLFCSFFRTLILPNSGNYIYKTDSPSTTWMLHKNSWNYEEALHWNYWFNLLHCSDTLASVSVLNLCTIFPFILHYASCVCKVDVNKWCENWNHSKLFVEYSLSITNLLQTSLQRQVNKQWRD